MIRKIFFLLILSFVSTAALATFARPASWNSIKHIVVIVLENTDNPDAVRQPFMKSLLTTGAYTANFFAITHPSQPNYLAMVGGSTYGVTSNSNVTLDAMHIGNLLDAKGLTWKAYAEGYPGNCFLGESRGNYARKHEPFISYRTVQNTPSECAKIVPGPDFFTDAATNNLPTLSFYVPDLLNDGHDTGVTFADNWLKNTFGPLFSNPNITKDTLFVVTFDEDDSANNNVYTAFVGAAVKPGTTSNVRYTLYSLLKTIESIFQLGSLCTNDASATEISDIWLP